MVMREDEKGDEVGEKMATVKLEDILQLSPPGSTFILKLDIESFDCQVLSDTEIFDKYSIPFMLVEWQIQIQINDSGKLWKACQDLKPKLRALGYTPYW